MINDKMVSLDLVNEKMDLVFERDSDNEIKAPELSDVESSESSTYLEPDFGKLDVGPATYLPKV